MTRDEAKRAAAVAAAQLVQPGMIVGLGTGTTAAHFVTALAARKLDVAAVATSAATAEQARTLGIALIEPVEETVIDLCVDGADEIDPQLRLIKGGGAALLREKIVAAAARRMVVIADDSKCVARLGAYPLPVEIAPFSPALTLAAVRRALAAHGCGDAVLSWRQSPARTEGGGLLLDCACKDIPDPEGLAHALAFIPGVVEHGLFLGLATEAIVAGAEGVRTLRAPIRM